MEYDVFISHASEDKEEFVEPLAAELKKSGLSVWYDRFVLKLGDSLRARIDEGLRESRYGVVVLSPAFFEKRWPQAELDALFTRQAAEEEKVLLPVWHNMRACDVAKESPLLASIYAAHSGKGLLGVVGDILEVAKPDLGRYAKDDSGRYICQVQSGPFDGIHVLLVDAPPAPFGGPSDILKGDVIPYAEIAGKPYIAGLVRREKLPHLLTDKDMWSLPSPNTSMKVEWHGSTFRVSQPWARYKFNFVQRQPDGTLIPVFTFREEEIVVVPGNTDDFPQ